MVSEIVSDVAFAVVGTLVIAGTVVVIIKFVLEPILKTLERVLGATLNIVEGVVYIAKRCEEVCGREDEGSDVQG